MKAISNMSRLQVTSDFLLQLLKVYEAKGKEFYYDDVFERDYDVFTRKVIEDNVYYIGKVLKLDLTDTRLRLLSRKKMIPKNKTEAFLLNIKLALTQIQKHPKEFELLVNEYDNLARILSKDFEPIKFNQHDVMVDVLGQKKKVTKKDELENLIKQFNQQQKTKLYELTQLITNFYVDYLNMNLFTAHNDVVGYIVLYAFLLRDFNVFKYVPFFEYFYKAFNQYDVAIKQANYYWATGYPQTDALSKTIIEILSASYEKIDSMEREYSFESKINKSNNIEATIMKGPTLFSKEDIRIAHPTIALITIDRTLKRLKEEGKIIPLGKGRSTKWQKIEESKRKGSQQLDIFQFVD